jgi:hypothetical protein
MRKFWFIILVGALAAGVALARPASKVNPMMDYKSIGFAAQKFCGADPNEQLPIPVGSQPDGPRRDEAIGDPRGVVAIGDDYVIGYTYYDYQHNGSISKMLAKDSQGNVHFTWMCGYDADNDPRHMVYNYLSNSDLLLAPDDRGVVDNGTRSGYGHLALLPYDERAGVFYHVLGYEGAPNNTWLTWAMSIDYGYAWGAFGYSYPPTWPGTQVVWPKGCFDRNNISHIIGYEYQGDGGPLWARVAYSRGVAENEDFQDWEWYDAPIDIDTTSVISQVASASATSDRVVLAWHHNRVGTDPEGIWSGFGGGYQRNNDIRYIVSEDGENWDWENGIQSITKIIPIDPRLLPDREKAYGDTLRPYCDVDIQFDPWGDDNLYAVFAASGFQEEPDPTVGQPVNLVYAVHGDLWFWNSVEDTITLVFNGWYYNYTDQGGGRFRPGGWRINADRGSIAFNPDDPGTIYVVWVNFPKIMEPIFDDNGNLTDWDWLEGAQDTSGLGYSNAEIMVSISTDYGITWREPVNITNTKWPADSLRAPEPGECLSENWVSAAYLADDTLHIQYILDLDAGGVPQNEGEAKNDPVIYHRVAIDDLPLNDPIAMPRDGFMFHNYPKVRIRITEVTRNPGVPVTNSPVTVTATVLSGEDVNINQVTLIYRLNGAADEHTVQMAHVEGDFYAAQIPEQGDGTRVWYMVRASDEDNFEVVSPQVSPPAIWFYSYTVRPQGGLSIYDIQYRPRDWAVDYSPYVGYEVTVKGTVTTPATFNQLYGAYAIQDSEKAWNGVMVRGISDDLNVGDYIEVTGIVGEKDLNDPIKWEFATHIDVSSYQVIEQRSPIEPVDVEGVAELTFANRAEELEAVYIILYDFWVDTLDGIDPETTVYWPIENNTGGGGWFTTIGMPEDQVDTIRNFRQGTGITQMTGVFTENNGHYALAPRTILDVGNTGAPLDGNHIPFTFRLDPVYPNPFNAITNVSFELPRTGYAQLGVYDVSGRLVASVLDGELKAGSYELRLDASSLATGVYFLHLEAGEQNTSQKLVLLK